MSRNPIITREQLEETEKKAKEAHEKELQIRERLRQAEGDLTRFQLEKLEKEREEDFRFYGKTFDFAKHMTTLSSGSIVILATFIRDDFVSEEAVALLPFIFTSLIVALAISAISMFIYILVPVSKHTILFINLACVAVGVVSFVTAMWWITQYLILK